MENSSIAIAIISFGATVITVILKQPLLSLIEFFEKRKIKKFLNRLEPYAFFEGKDKDFCDKFLFANLKELYFQYETGIKTDCRWIDRYVILRNKTSNHLPWNDIRKVRQYLSYNDEKIIIKVRPFEKVASVIYLCLALLVFIIGFVFLFSTMFFKSEHGLETLFFQVSIPILCSLITLGILNIIDPIRIAIRLEKDLGAEIDISLELDKLLTAKIV